MSCEEFFHQQLRERGFRMTPQREIILSVLHRIEGLATAEEIHRQVKKISTSIDISTVYRTLELLQDFHLVAEIDLGDGQNRYELLKLHEHHIHLVCQQCGKVIGIGLEKLQPFIAYAEGHYGFRIDVDQLNVPGICETCAAANERHR